MQSDKYIHSLFAGVFNMLESINKSLSKELEYLDSQTVRMPKVIQAKQRQIENFKEFGLLFDQIYDHIIDQEKESFNLRACLLYYGVSPQETDFFIDRNQLQIDFDLKGNVQDSIFQVPEKIRSFIDQEKIGQNWDSFEKGLFKVENQKQNSESDQIRKASAPVLGIENIKKLLNQIAA